VTEPQVSVILPCYEGERWLRRAIESVTAQTGASWELVVVDDGSSRSPKEIVQSFQDERIRLYEISHAGKGAALNRGAAESRAGLLCFLDQDDLMLPGRLCRQCAVFDDEPAAEAVYSDYERVTAGGERLGRLTSRQASGEECLRQMARGGSLISMQTLMLRKHVYETLGPFSENPDLTGMDDAEFLARLFASGVTLRYTPGVVQQWTLHEGNYSGSAAFQETRAVLLEHLENLTGRYPSIAGILPRYRYHNTCARGLYFLEKAMPREAAAEFAKMIRLRPFAWNGYYLLAKSCLKIAQAVTGAEGTASPS
jgi:glycosyltransferase involved in cell wall biosynthesis